jgi:hypothetical protein
VDYSRFVRRLESVCYLFGDFDNVFGQQTLSRQTFSQRHSLHELNSYEMCLINVIDFMNRNDVWMIECRDRAGFLTETQHPSFVGSKLVRENL